MGRLETRYGDQVDFIHIDWDDADSREIISNFAAPRRSTYIILDPEGNVRWTFIGLLDDDVVSQEIERVLNE